MPLIFVSSKSTKRGQVYDDRTGSSYQFPKQYRKLVKPGERFVYYRGSEYRNLRKVDLDRQPIYFGAGLVGVVKEDNSEKGKLICEIIEYKSFPKTVPFKDERGHYLEPVHNPVYWRNGVRWIPDCVFELILEKSSTNEPQLLNKATVYSQGGGHTYASPETAKKVDEFAMKVALREVRRIYPNEEVVQLPRNNPGFDIRVGADESVVAYVEVKGTQKPKPSFFMSEGERRFSEEKAAQYILLVVYDIKLDKEEYKLIEHRGAVAHQNFILTPTQWICELISVD
ncbi:DUF3883 domain-containing protein [Microcoleus sp. ZQ-A2]|nr:DUF3883 domain-containing protein [Microcoleus sp. FACHB-1]